MLTSVRCFSCHKVVAHYERCLSEGRRNGADMETLMDELKISRICCRRMLMTAARENTTANYTWRDREQSRGRTKVHAVNHQIRTIVDIK